MEIKLVKFGFRFRFYLNANLRRVKTVTGVNSQIDDNTHFLMWDFDDVPLSTVEESLKSVQDMFYLPAISIIKTKEYGYHAYCFKACSFVEARGIIGLTANVDRHFLAAGCSRGYFTLRFSEFEGRGFEHCITLFSDIKSDLDYSDINCFVEYTKAVK